MIYSNNLVGDLLENFLVSHRHAVRLFSYDEHIQEKLLQCSHWADLIIADVVLHKGRTPPIVEAIHARFPAVPILLISSAGEVLRSEEAMKNGIFGYLHKPISLSELELMLERIKEISAKTKKTS